MNMRKKTIEDYVETIYIMQKEKEIVHTNDIASALDINPASVTEIFHKLSDEGYINYEKYSGVVLTEKGRKIGIDTKKKHDILKRFLILLGVDDKIADEDACKIEHNVNPETMKKLRTFVKFANLEDGCSSWLDHFKYFDKTGKYIKCIPKDQQKCPIHAKKK
jgi:Mn-dependent DtxR family transcriptional regulator